MAADDLFPAEMPDHHHPTLPLDDDTAERLLAGRLHPEDAPPGYAEVTRLLRAAAGPPSPEELAGEEGALGMFRAARSRRGPVGARRRPAPARSRMVALTLAGTLVAAALWIGGGVPTAGEALVAGGVWIADGARSALGLGSPSGGPSSGGSGSGAPGAGAGVAGGPESLRPATGRLAGGRPADRDGRGVTGRGGGSAHGIGPGSHGKPPKEKPSKKKPSKDDAGPDKPKSKGPKAKPAKGKAAKA
jgi:hypothetical protein